MLGLQGVFRSHLVAQHIRCCQLAIGFIVHVFQQFHNSQPSLTEASDDERALLVAMSLEMVEGLADILHRQSGSMIDGIFILCFEGFNRCMTIERCIETVAWGHVGSYAIYLYGHTLAMRGVPHVGVVTDRAICCHPIFFPRRDHIKHIGTCSLQVAVLRYPHGRV